MNRSRTSERRVDTYRTVTQIADAETVYQKTFDVRDLDSKSEVYLRETEKREMCLILAKYIAMVQQLKIPDIKLVFGSKNNSEHLLMLVSRSLAFINHQVFPHCTTFVDMDFNITEERKYSIPGEPIVFYKPINSEAKQTVRCFIDRPSIIRILDKPVDVKLMFDKDDCRTNIVTGLLDKIKMIETQHCMNKFQRFATSEFVCTTGDFKMEEEYITQFVILLIIFSWAYLGYYKLQRTDFQQYFDFMHNHESLERHGIISNLGNLFITKFRFKISEDSEKRSASGMIFKKIKPS
ncbi:odv-ec27 [Hyphantria cunea granulovirus]|uniref:Odv-ec27 n=1 Tax=Hyphantria cunea granulovirus TaxID=307448 RepID=A0AAE6D0K3_9BBAC|nr:odv-ec27 [Hyphantria cunea granulovirus]QBQ01639.1 odv-ec27 [Hyphantria cunea granulovirus]